MRALVVHAGNIWGGVERVLVSLARITRDSGPRLEFAIVFEGTLAKALRAQGSRVHIVGPARASRPWSWWTARRRLATIVKLAPPDVLVTQSAWSLALFGGVAQDADVPLVHWVHDVLGDGHWTQRLASHRRPDLLVCNSHYSAACAAPVFPDVPSEVIYAPLDGSPMPAAAPSHTRQRLDTADDAIVILQVGRTDPQKGHSVLLEALTRLEGDPTWVCWQVGAPQTEAERAYWRSIEQRAVTFGLGGRVRFAGHLQDVRAAFAAADVYCQLNTGPEAYGLTLVEAMQAGLPIVTSRLGAAREVLEGTENILVEPADPASAASALRALICDPAARRRIGAQGPRRVAALGDDGVVRQALIAALTRVRRTPNAA